MAKNDTAYDVSVVLINQDTAYTQTRIYTGKAVPGTNGVNLRVHCNGEYVTTRRLAGASRAYILAEVLADHIPLKGEPLGYVVNQGDYETQLPRALGAVGWIVVATTGGGLIAPRLSIPQVDYTRR